MENLTESELSDSVLLT